VDLEHIKNQFEMVKDTETFVITTETVKWLIDEVEKRENYWVDKHLNSLGQNIKLNEDIQIKENHNQILRKSNREYQQAFEQQEKELERLEKALEFYADEKSWHKKAYSRVNNIIIDGGDLARQVLGIEEQIEED
jgi:hypothetical protein